MNTRFPAVQKSCSRAYRVLSKHGRGNRSEDKRSANRRHRRALSLVAHELQRDPDRFESELFSAPTMSRRDVI